ncbi:unnamed protein product [Ceutorhynchus assimilis]|uniref:Uncharacterized protein n=1 Tax=Ceutorhynchus assimilis TaxID=467358 RepID=A0A9N9QN49_9CUCU|nr:unnamed protein product [Ceutorhynchus assimilis]
MKKRKEKREKRDKKKIILKRYKKRDPLQKTNNILNKNYPNVFSLNGVIKGIKAQMVVKDNATPVFHKVYSVTYALKPVVDQELDDMKRVDLVKTINYKNELYQKLKDSPNNLTLEQDYKKSKIGC